MKPEDWNATKPLLRKSVKNFLDMASDTGVNMARSGVYDSPQSQATLERTKKDFNKFFGFLHNIKGWELKGMQLSDYSNTDMVGQFISYLHARGVRVTELINQVTLARRVNL
jgi:hypothetical protein